MTKLMITMIVAPTALACAALATPASAAGCLKGAAVGGVAGHVAGHHALLGAGAGCVIGRHEANKHARQQNDAQNAQTIRHDGQPERQP